MILIFGVSGCANTPQTSDTVCGWMTYPKMTENDVDTMSPQLVTWIDDVIRHYTSLCVKQ